MKKKLYIFISLTSKGDWTRDTNPGKKIRDTHTQKKKKLNGTQRDGKKIYIYI